MQPTTPTPDPFPPPDRRLVASILNFVADIWGDQIGPSEAWALADVLDQYMSDTIDQQEAHEALSKPQALAGRLRNVWLDAIADRGAE